MATPNRKKPRAKRTTPEIAREELRDAGRRYSVARAELEDAVEARDSAIIRASGAGLSRREVATLGGVTVGRVQQVLDALQADTRSRLNAAAAKARDAKPVRIPPKKSGLAAAVRRAERERG